MFVKNRLGIKLQQSRLVSRQEKNKQTKKQSNLHKKDERVDCCS